MKPVVLIVYAVEQEHVELNGLNVSVKYCKTGVGKVNAALAVIDAIAKFKPALVVNLATAGSVNHTVGSIHLCARFVDRDMEKLQAFNVTWLEDFSDDENLKLILGDMLPHSVCNTGDTFLTSIEGDGDVFDMEAFAIARACRVSGVPFVAVKYVTDIIGQNSIKHWAEKLADARADLENYMTNKFLPTINL